MPKFLATVKGEFEVRQEVFAENIEEAKKKFENNEGYHIEETAVSPLEVSEIDEVE